MMSPDIFGLKREQHEGIQKLFEDPDEKQQMIN